MNGLVGFLMAVAAFVVLSVVEEILGFGGLDINYAKWICLFLIVVWINEQFFGGEEGEEDADSTGDPERLDWRSGDSEAIRQGLCSEVPRGDSPDG